MKILGKKGRCASKPMPLCKHIAILIVYLFIHLLNATLSVCVFVCLKMIQFMIQRIVYDLCEIYEIFRLTQRLLQQKINCQTGSEK